LIFVRFLTYDFFMTNALAVDIAEQPAALRRLVDHYRGAWTSLFRGIDHALPPLLTGMGASYHAASIATLNMQRYGLAAFSVEAIDLLNYSSMLLTASRPLIFVSQSGGSGEVIPVTDKLPDHTTLIAITNESSALAKRAKHVLPILAGSEALVATKTFVNSYAVLWMLSRQWIGAWDGSEFDTLAHLADVADQLLNADEIAAHWLDLFGRVDTFIFAGHGPHYWTARQAAMMAGEWSKVSVLSTSIGAFRHGLIESVTPRTGLILFTAPGATLASTLKLANELNAHQVPVLIVSAGQTYLRTADVPDQVITDEFLSPLLDTITAQRFIQRLAEQRGVEPGFRYISKVVTEL